MYINLIIITIACGVNFIPGPKALSKWEKGKKFIILRIMGTQGILSEIKKSKILRSKKRASKKKAQKAIEKFSKD